MIEKPVYAPARIIHVASRHLPLACPIPGEEGWEFHPRVYLDVLRTGEATCPYCNTSYVFTGPKPEAQHDL